MNSKYLILAATIAFSVSTLANQARHEVGPTIRNETANRARHEVGPTIRNETANRARHEVGPQVELNSTVVQVEDSIDLNEK